MTRGGIAEGGSPQDCGLCSTPDVGAEAPTAEGMGRAVAAASSLQRPRAREDSKLDGLAKITRTHPHSSQYV
jgi:hypothetical protein